MCVVGARPNFTKISPIMKAMAGSEKLAARLVHTGQHYDQSLKQTFFDQLQIPEPDIDLGVGSGSHAVQTAEVMRRFEPVLDEEKPAAVLVVGDVNSTIACSLVAVKKGIPVIHVEAGLRSFDRSMPEEINRVLTDQISDLLFTTERQALFNLEKEGIDKSRVHFVGNVMIDNLKQQLPRAVSVEKLVPGYAVTRKQWKNGYVLLTMHRPSNVDDGATLKRLLEVVNTISRNLPVIFPVHPRTRNRINEFALNSLLDNHRLYVMDPVGYLEMLGLMAGARVILTDSGGIQEESTSLGVPCLTLRENTERPITVTEGTNTIVGTDVADILTAFQHITYTGGKAGNIPENWDGIASQRIVEIIETWLPEQQQDMTSRQVV